MLIKLWGRCWVDPKEVVSVGIVVDDPRAGPEEHAIQVRLRSGHTSMGFADKGEALVFVEAIATTINEALK